VRHIKDRRDRLKQLALDNLPITEVERLGLSSERVLDSHASEVTQLLQNSGIRVPTALAVVGNERLPVYQALCWPADAELFFRAGFHDTDSWCNADAAELDVFPNLVQDLPYLHWLTKHGGISFQLSFASARDIFTAHYTFWNIGNDLTNYWPGKFLRFGQSVHTINSESPFEPPLDDRIAWIRELHTAVLPANIADACRCQCSLGGCTPLTSLLKGAMNHLDFIYKPRHSPEDSVAEDRDDLENSTGDNTDFLDDSVTDDSNPLLDLITGFILYLEHFWCHLEVRHHITALRYITYTALGIRHSCCDPYSYDMSEDEVEDEEYKLELLEELLCEFEEAFMVIFQGPDQGFTSLAAFWQRTWVGRMSEVLDRLEGSDLPDDERRGAEEIGVVWDKPRPESPGVIGNPHRTTTLDFWMYELEKIEAECQ
jgi:hypothetical protein